MDLLLNFRALARMTDRQTIEWALEHNLLRYPGDCPKCVVQRNRVSGLRLSDRIDIEINISGDAKTGLVDIQKA